MRDDARPNVRPRLPIAALLLALGLLLHLATAPPAGAAAPAAGEQAPEFVLPGSDGEMHSLAKLKAEGRGVVLAWFPKAFTPG